MNAETIQRLRDEAREVLFQEQEEKREHIYENTDALLLQIKACKKWYCRRNQPRNYIRMICTIPVGMLEVPFCWSIRLQVFAKNTKNIVVLQEDLRISANAYNLLKEMSSLEWEHRFETGYPVGSDKYIYKHPDFR